MKFVTVKKKREKKNLSADHKRKKRNKAARRVHRHTRLRLHFSLRFPRSGIDLEGKVVPVHALCALLLCITVHLETRNAISTMRASTSLPTYLSKPAANSSDPQSLGNKALFRVDNALMSRYGFSITVSYVCACVYTRTKLDTSSSIGYTLDKHDTYSKRRRKRERRNPFLSKLLE